MEGNETIKKQTKKHILRASQELRKEQIEIWSGQVSLHGVYSIKIRPGRTDGIQIDRRKKQETFYGKGTARQKKAMVKFLT